MTEVFQTQLKTMMSIKTKTNYDDKLSNLSEIGIETQSEMT